MGHLSAPLHPRRTPYTTRKCFSIASQDQGRGVPLGAMRRVRVPS